MSYHVLTHTQCLGLMNFWIGWARLDFFDTGFDQGLLADSLVTRI